MTSLLLPAPSLPGRTTVSPSPLRETPIPPQPSSIDVAAELVPSLPRSSRVYAAPSVPIYWCPPQPCFASGLISNTPIAASSMSLPSCSRGRCRDGAIFGKRYRKGAGASSTSTCDFIRCIARRVSNVVGQRIGARSGKDRPSVAANDDTLPVRLTTGIAHRYPLRSP